MICVSVMLAIFLGWPLAFGDHHSRGLEVPAQGHGVAAAAERVSDAVPRLVQSAQATTVSTAPRAESCYKRYQRELPQCTGNGGAACRLKAADNWDLCEATGFWPQ